MGVKQSKNGSGTWEVSAWYRDWQGERHRKHKRGFKTRRRPPSGEVVFCQAERRARHDFEDFVAIYKATASASRLNTWKDKENIIQTKIMRTSAR